VRALCTPVSEFQSRRSSRRNQPTQKQEHVDGFNCTRRANNALHGATNMTMGMQDLREIEIVGDLQFSIF